MTESGIELYVGDVSDMEARVYARYRPEAGSEVSGRGTVVLRGILRGPFCERAHTLPAEYPFRDVGPQQPGLAEALVPDPCLWSEELPQLYHAEVEAVRGDQIVADYRGAIGLRKSKSNAERD